MEFKYTYQIPLKIRLKCSAVLLVSVLFFSGSFHKLNAQAEAVPADADVIAAGEKLFRQNCAACHRIQEKLIGPGLANVYDRRDIAWIQAFVKNSQKVIQSGDPYAVDMFEEYNQIVMPPVDFSDEEILSILAYIKDQTDKLPQAAVTIEEAVDTGAAAEQGLFAGYMNYILAGLIITLILMIVVLVMISSVMQKFLRTRSDLDEADREIIAQRFNLLALLQSRAFIGIVAFVFTAIAFKTVIDQLYEIGVQQGYAPEQPIAFSHKVHAGQYEIDCNYCHTGVMKSKNANIPSPNICMNCHSSITEGVNTGTKEISKIYAAIEENRPIEWVRVHNLPDFAYFNHSQHVNVGKVECATCHGPVEEMEVVRQYSLLTMGWCVDCHRTTKVNTKDNAYYDKLVEFHNSPELMTVESIGGLECAKCHY